LFAAGLSQAALGIYQFGLRGDGPEHFLVLGRFYRAYGTFNQPNPYGGFMNLTAVLGLGIFLGYLPIIWEIGDWRLRRFNLQSLISNLRSVNGLPVFAVGSATAVALMAVIFSWSRGRG
jgi:putative inorganic carbon (HCO3(-)) transporter